MSRTIFSAFLSEPPGLVHQRKSAKLERGALPDLLLLERDELERAAAKVARDAIGLVQAADDAERRQFRLALAGKELGLHAHEIMHARQEIRAVLRVARRGRRDDAGVSDVHLGA